MNSKSNFQTLSSCIGQLRRFVRRAAFCGALAAISSAAWAASFGTIVPIGGNASDIVLDESRGVLYIANFTANRIELMSTSDLTIHQSINVSPQPGAIAMSPNGRWLVVTHFGNFDITSKVPSQNSLSVIDLGSNAVQTFSLGFPPLGVAFGNDGRALILTTNDFILFDPVSGAIQVLDTVSNVIAKTLPVVGLDFSSGRHHRIARQLRATVSSYTALTTRSSSSMMCRTRFFRRSATPLLRPRVRALRR